MDIRRFVRRAGLVAAVLAASFFIVPGAFARVHVGVGISLPGVAIGVGNCWRCGYVAAPPVYYAQAYPAPVYYPAPAYYAPAPVYYGYSYGYYAPYYPRPYYHHGYYRGPARAYARGGYYHHR